MCLGSQPAQPSSPAQALAMLHASLGYLATCDAPALGTAAQAEALIGLEQAGARHTAARAKILAAFSAGHGFQADGQFGAKPWLRAFTKVTRVAAAGTAGWARRLAGHPAVAAALADARISTSWARQICDWTDALPDEHRADADAILLAAASGGADLHDLGALAREMTERARTSPDDGDDGFADRALWLDTTMGGAGQVRGDLTGECATALSAVLDALSGRAGPEDTRSVPQRRHDALEEACPRLIAARMLPGRDGQPVHVQVHIDLSTLRGLPGGSALEDGWSPARAAAAPGSVYLTGAAAEAAACDATLTPVVTGQIDWTALDQLTTLFLNAHGHTLNHAHSHAHGQGQDQGHGHGQDTSRRHGTAGRDRRPDPPEISAALRARLRDTLLAMSIDLLSGPGGLASCLRTSLLGQPYNSLSQPLDIGAPTPEIPPHLRKAVILRDKHCGFAGCHQPPSVCQVHHLIPRSQGGPTALGNLKLLCRFHHLIVIHRWGWTLTCHPDGTTTATAPDGRTLHSHSPPRQTA